MTISHFRIPVHLIVVIFVCLVEFGLLTPTVSADDVSLATADVVLRNGIIYDGSDKPGRKGDVAIKSGRIVAVGELTVERIDVEIDCQGLIIAPGFIDLHNHSDRQILDEATRSNLNYLTQGCTTIVTGNCGSGPVNVGEYYQKIDEQGAGTNVLHLLPQGSLRNDVMATANRAPTDVELLEMQRLAAKAMQEGAWGMSTGLIYVPSSYATTDEIVRIAEVVSQSGGIYVSHIRSEGPELLVAVNEALDIGRSARLPVHISHFKSSGQESWGLVRRAATIIEDAQKRGEQVSADQYPYTASSTSLEATLIPAWARAGGNPALVKRLNDPETSERLIAEITESLKSKGDGAPIFLARYSARPEWVGKNVFEIAHEQKTEPLDIVLQITRNGGASIVNFGMSEDDVRHVMSLPWVATASDGRAYIPGSDRPHPRSYGTFPRKIGHYALHEKVISLEHALRSATSLPAKIIGLTDRGWIKPDYVADIVVFDPQQFIDIATFEKPHQHSQGVVHVFVNGKAAIKDGVPTGLLAGRSVRHVVSE
ncbi:MAG: D-aminoacylase [Planctomycetota bacterium]|nr:D-aminoacylase [Planctomycetota bacterium]MDA1212401.1 D-aminoacylase [Planctomycetota bacterium]